MKLVRFLFCIAIFLCLPVFCAATDSRESFSFAGQSLEQALRALQLKGLNVVYSSDLVRPEMRVSVEPTGRSPRDLLKGLLSPHKLKAEDGPGNTLLVVYSKNGAKEAMATAAAITRMGSSEEEVIVPFVNITLTVQDNNNQYVTNLTADDFVVKENGRPQTIIDFANHAEMEEALVEPLIVLFLLDSSQSMNKLSAEGTRRVDVIKEAALGLLDYFQPEDRFLAMGFHTETFLYGELTSDFETIRQSIETQKVGNTRTAMYDSVIVAIKELQKYSGRKVIILCSDGEDNASKASLKEVILAVGSSDISIFTFAGTPSDYFAKRGAENLKRISEAAGGSSFFYSNNVDIREYMANAGKAIRSQYIIGYYPSNYLHGWRRLEVECKVPKVRLRYRKTYLF